ncbi:MAG: dephospho-CoA kinase [Propionicimonas sp.]
MVTRIGLTGGIASGKSTVADRLAERGAVIIDSDLLAREAVAPGSAGLRAVIARFGEQVLAADGSLNRAALGSIIFDDPQARRDLEAIIHPAVRARAAELTAAAAPGSVVVQVIPLLVETGQSDAFDQVWVVDVDPAVQRARLQERDGLSPAEAQARMQAQASRAQRLAVADVVLANDGSADQLRQQVDQEWEKLRGSA